MKPLYLLHRPSHTQKPFAPKIHFYLSKLAFELVSLVPYIKPSSFKY